MPARAHACACFSGMSSDLQQRSVVHALRRAPPARLPAAAPEEPKVPPVLTPPPACSPDKRAFPLRAALRCAALRCAWHGTLCAGRLAAKAAAMGLLMTAIQLVTLYVLTVAAKYAVMIANSLSEAMKSTTHAMAEVRGPRTHRPTPTRTAPRSASRARTMLVEGLKASGGALERENWRHVARGRRVRRTALAPRMWGRRPGRPQGALRAPSRADATRGARSCTQGRLCAIGALAIARVA